MLNSDYTRTPRRRTIEVDLLRSVALLGICVVNVPFLAGVDILRVPEAAGDRVAAFVVEFLFQGKFFILFSFLFGWGFAVQMESAIRRQRAFATEYVRRLVGLLLIGIAHALLVFVGDILVLYALLGSVLWFLRGLAPRTLLRVAAALVGLEFLTLCDLAILLSEPIDDSGVTSGYRYGFLAALEQRWFEWPYALGFIGLFNGPSALAAFCCGLAAAKTGFFDRGAASYAALKRRWPLLLSLGLVLNGAYALSLNDAFGTDLAALFAFAGLAVGAPCLSSVYLLAIVELGRRGVPPGSTSAGRMSLTAYVAEGVLAGLLFNGYGLGYFGQFGELSCLGIAIGIYAVVHVACALWLRRQSHGPLERLLRLITRGKRWKK